MKKGLQNFPSKCENISLHKPLNHPLRSIIFVVNLLNTQYHLSVYIVFDSMFFKRQSQIPPISYSQCWIFGEAFSRVVFDNEVPDCLVWLIFSVMRFDLLVLIGGFHEFPNFLSWTVVELAFLTGFVDRGNVTEIWKTTDKQNWRLR